METCGEAEQYLAGGQRREGRLELRIDDRVSALFKAEHLAQGQDTLDPDVNRMRLQLRYRLRLR
jgi:hypothetical protein